MKRFSLFLLICLAACGGVSSSDGGTNDEFSLTDCEGLDEFQAPAGVSKWAYWIDAPQLDQLAESDADLVVIDYSNDGSVDGEFTEDDLDVIHDAGKLAIAYFSIGEAEDYRFYWDAAWVDGDNQPTDEAPSWLYGENPEWEGNFKVKYWEDEWKNILFGDTDGDDKSYLDRIIDAGFDGVYLDIIDAYEYFTPDGESGVDRESAGNDMIELVKEIADYARETRGEADFLVFPQNGVAVMEESDGCTFAEAINGVGSEDNFYFGDEDNNNELDEEHANEVTPYLDALVGAGKMVLAVDYLTDEDRIENFYELAEEHGYLPYAAERALDQLYAQP